MASSRGMLRNAGVVGGLTMLSRVLGLVRDVLMAGWFGNQMLASAFFAAYRLPNLFRRLFGEGALSAALVPSVVHCREEEGQEAAWKLGRQVISLVAVLLGMILAVLVGGASLALPHVESEQARLVLSFSRVLLPYMWFICLAALMMSLLHSVRHFAVPAAVPIVLNLMWIAAVPIAAIWYADDPEKHLHAISVALVIAGMIQLVVQLPTLRRFGFRMRWSPAWRDARVRGVIQLALPAALGAAVTQVNTLIDTFIALFIGKHAVASLFYSERLIYLPLGIFATAMSTVLLPTFSQQVSSNDQQGLRSTLQQGLRIQLFIMVPAAIGLLSLAEPILRTLFERKEFTALSTWQTAWALRFYAPGLVVFGLAKILVPVFYGSRDTRTPVRLSLVAMGVNLTLNIVFVLTWPEAIRHAGLAAATVCSEALYAWMLARSLHRRLGDFKWGPVGWAALKALVAATAMGFAAWGAERYVRGELLTLTGPGFITSLLGLLAGLGVGVVVYFALSALLRSRELADVTKAITRKKRG